MTMPPVPSLGWSFLVARGRSTGHRVCLVPGVLDTPRLTGLLEDHAAGGSGGSDVNYVDTGTVQLAIVVAQYRVRGSDLSDGGSSEYVLDEHSRPLVIRYGFVCLDVTVDAVDETDTHVALAQALAVFREFLRAETEFVPPRSEPFRIRSAITPLTPVVPPSRLKAWVERLRRRNIRAAVIAAGCLLVTVIGGGWWVLGAHHAGQDSATASSAVPSALVGAWNGRVSGYSRNQRIVRPVSLTVSCPGPCGGDVGKVVGRADDGVCGYQLILKKSGASVMEVMIKPTRPLGCLPSGLAYVRLTGPDTVCLVGHVGGGQGFGAFDLQPERSGRKGGG